MSLFCFANWDLLRYFTKLIYRYIAVCAPFFRLRNRIKASYYILPILLFAPLYNIPRFFELESTKETRYFCEEEANETDVLRGITKVIVELDENQYDNLMNGNSSMLVFNCTNSTKNTLTATDFRKDPLYVKVCILNVMHQLLLCKITNTELPNWMPICSQYLVFRY